MFSDWQKPLRGAQLDRTHPIARGLIACWLFNECSGASLFDYSGNQNHGAITDGSWLPTKMGPALKCTRLLTGISIGDNPILRPTKEITIRSLFYIQSGQADGDWPFFLEGCQTDGGGTSGFRLFRRQASQNKIMRWRIFIDASAYNTDDTVALPEDAYHDVVAVFDGTQTILYRNNEIKATGGAAGSITQPPAGTTLYISNSYLGGDDNLQGWMILTQIWSRALEAGEVEYLYSQPYAMFDQPSRAKYFYVTAAAAASPTGALYGPLVGPTGGPV